MLMRSSLLLGGLLSSVVIVTAFAQSNPPAPAATPAPSATTTTTTSTSAMWRASKLVGVNVYNDQDEKLGAISELLVDKSGKVDGVIVGVGGFLGMGSHDIKVDMAKLKFVDEPVKTSSTTTTSTTGAGGGAMGRPAGTTSTTSASSSKKWYPDHAVLSGASKDQLKAMPEFKYD
jgi:sporulation protein YlmC with PRC-barrel domain